MEFRVDVVSSMKQRGVESPGPADHDQITKEVRDPLRAGSLRRSSDREARRRVGFVTA